MTVFSKNTLTQVAGFDNPIISRELIYGQKAFWNLELNNGAIPVDLTGASVNAQVLRRSISNLADTRSGLSFDIADYSPAPSAITIPISNRDDTFGRFTLVLDDAVWGLFGSDAQLDISATSPVAFSGRLKIGFPAVGSSPAQDSIIFLLFLIRSDGVVN
ncbi:MAG: hypothetical protein WBI20_14795 [Burkholderiaceae bacterium]